MFIKNILLKYKYYFIAFVSLCLIVAGSFIFKDDSKRDPVVASAMELNEKENSSEVKEELKTYSIDIKGAVKHPGVYKVVNGSNVYDVIELAGGLNKNATTDNINLSKKVSDEMVIYIYTKSEYNKNNNTINKSPVEQQDCKENINTADISSCVSNSSSIITNDSNNPTNDNISESNETNSLININTATKDELMSINGIGESKALCIISYRNEVGSFKSIEEVMNVSGIGNALFEKIKNLITV